MIQTIARVIERLEARHRHTDKSGHYKPQNVWEAITCQNRFLLHCNRTAYGHYSDLVGNSSYVCSIMTSFFSFFHHDYYSDDVSDIALPLRHASRDIHCRDWSPHFIMNEDRNHHDEPVFLAALDFRMTRLCDHEKIYMPWPLLTTSLRDDTQVLQKQKAL